MPTRILVLCAVIAAFGALTARALLDTGYVEIILLHLSNWASAQLLADLTIACLLICLWMLQDARRSGLRAWPFLLITLAAGSFGPLLYLLFRELRELRQRQRPA